HRLGSRIQSVAPQSAFDDDGGLAGRELPGRHSCRVARKLLEQHGQARILPHDCCCCRLRRRGILACQFTVETASRGTVELGLSPPGLYALPSAHSTTLGVIGISVIGLAASGASASLTALSTAPGAPAVPASPAPLAPSSESLVGVSTWATSMSGISAAIGTR